MTTIDEPSTTGPVTWRIAGVQTALPADDFRAIFRSHPAGVAVLALLDDGRPVGFTATSVISVSVEPPLLAFSLAPASSSWPAVARTRTLTVSFLADHQDDLAARFASIRVDRFAGGGWTTLPTGEPVIEEVASWVHAEVVQRTAVGSSYLVTVQAFASSLARERSTQTTKPLVYHDRRYHRIDDHSDLPAVPTDGGVDLARPQLRPAPVDIETARRSPKRCSDEA